MLAQTRNAPAKPNPFYVGQVVLFRPPVSGVDAVAVVTRIISRTDVALRITDGTALYPTGSFTATSTGWVI
jgi:hypothetical protein